MFELGGTGTLHRQSQRFLSNTYPGSEDDPGLRGLIVQLADGATLTTLQGDLRHQQSLVKWLAAFRLIRTSERNVEGAHSLISRELKRAPASKVAALSLQLRFPELRSLMTEIALHPQATWTRFITLCTRLPQITHVVD